jgi:hypothetical protein
MKKKYWNGTIPTKCEICGKPLTKYFIDGRTRMGPWAIMCPECFKVYGSDLGIGKGQKYKFIKKGVWEKC